MSSTVRIGMLGCGIVGTGFLRLLHERPREITSSVGAGLRITRLAVQNPDKRRDFDLTGVAVGSDPLSVAQADDVDLLIEVMGGADRSLPPVERALERGIPVVTANKHLIS